MNSDAAPVVSRDGDHVAIEEKQIEREICMLALQHFRLRAIDDTALTEFRNRGQFDVIQISAVWIVRHHVADSCTGVSFNAASRSRSAARSRSSASTDQPRSATAWRR